MKIYLIGSLRNPEVPHIATGIRALGLEVFDDWYAAGPEADDCWQKYEQARERNYRDALVGHAAEHVFHYDQDHLDDSSAGVLLLPAGKSGHLEAGYLIGQGKPVIIFMQSGEPERWDVMYRFAKKVVYDSHELYSELLNLVPTARPRSTYDTAGPVGEFSTHWSHGLTGND